MLNQINKSFAIYLLLAIFKHFLHTFSKQALNNFCPQDYLKVVKHRYKLTYNRMARELKEKDEAARSSKTSNHVFHNTGREMVNS